jgi:hypothetical protein
MRAIVVGNAVGIALLLLLLWDALIARPHSPFPLLATSCTGVFFLGVYLIVAIIVALIRRSLVLFEKLFVHFVLYSVVFFGLLHLLYGVKHLVD